MTERKKQQVGYLCPKGLLCSVKRFVTKGKHPRVFVVNVFGKIPTLHDLFSAFKVLL